MPNLLNSKGQLIEFAYNPDKKSAQMELIRIMGSSALVKSKNKENSLPTFPGANVFLPKPLLIHPESSSTTVSSAESSASMVIFIYLLL